MTTSKPEDHIPLPSENIMMHQWQHHGDLFHKFSWSTNEGGRSRLICTVYCCN